jgi:hypothetical protein
MMACIAMMQGCSGSRRRQPHRDGNAPKPTRLFGDAIAIRNKAIAWEAYAQQKIAMAKRKAE